jgi:hypothetical protein
VGRRQRPLGIRPAHDRADRLLPFFLGPIARCEWKVSYDAVDMYRVAGGRIVWRFLLCDWKGVMDQLTAGT